jgi:hypothetical protein
MLGDLGRDRQHAAERPRLARDDVSSPSTHSTPGEEAPRSLAEIGDLGDVESDGCSAAAGLVEEHGLDRIVRGSSGESITLAATIFSKPRGLHARPTQRRPALRDGHQGS